MKSQGLNPALFVRKGGELPLSGSALLELLQAVLDKGKPFRFCAKGSSMSPFVKDGDIITVSPLSGLSPRLGDVVAYISAETGRLIVHRVIGRRGECCLIRGDSAQEKQDCVAEAYILGRVTRVERNRKTVGLGLGPERRLIALLNRRRLSWKLAHLFGRILRALYSRRRGFARVNSR